MPLLESDGALNAVTLLEELQRRYPGDYYTSVLRTLQRRVHQWRAVHGPEREAYFAQEHPPGRLGLSDFTVCDELGVIIAGAAFAHRIYQFALAHSGWRFCLVLQGKESFIALSSGLQSALWRLGGVPQEHRTDSLSAAFNNLAEEQELTVRYAALCQHYGRTAPSSRATTRSRRRWTRRCAGAAYIGVRGSACTGKQIRQLHRARRAVQRTEPTHRAASDAGPATGWWRCCSNMK